MPPETHHDDDDSGREWCETNGDFRIKGGPLPINEHLCCCSCSPQTHSPMRLDPHYQEDPDEWDPEYRTKI